MLDDFEVLLIHPEKVWDQHHISEPKFYYDNRLIFLIYPAIDQGLLSPRNGLLF